MLGAIAGDIGCANDVASRVAGHGIDAASLLE
jgi:hypothetical protein